MANAEQLTIVRQGSPTWNAWRSENSKTAIDLSNADFLQTELSGANLAHTVMRGAVFTRVHLNAANLSGADLSGADLRGCRLRSADLSEANLTKADLSYAHLTDSKLNSTNLNKAMLYQTVLRGATVQGAYLFETVLADLDLHEVNGMDSCRHGGPSIVDHRTLIRSGPLPQAFLQGCGLPEILIEYLPSLIGARPVQFYSCFISYSAKDQEFAERLHADLQDKGVRCWFAPEDLKIGDRFRQRIDEEIRLHDRLMLILSGSSVGSDWVRDEVEAALERERQENRIVLFPVQLDDAVMDTGEAWAASVRRQRHIGNFKDWKSHDSYIKSFDRLLRDLKQERLRTVETG